MENTAFNPFEMARNQFDTVADMLGLNQATRDLLRSPMREYSFSIPVRMDDGSVTVFRGLEKPFSFPYLTHCKLFRTLHKSISGLRLNLIYTKNASMTGVDLGFIPNMNTGSFTGFQSCLVGSVEGNFTGLQWDFVSLVGGNFEGLQMGFYNGSGHVSGVQFGFNQRTPER